MITKKISLISVFVILFYNVGFFQNIDYGILFEYNNSSHTNLDPTKPEDGTFQWNSLSTFGIGIYGSKVVAKKLLLYSSFKFTQHGYNEDAQTGIIFAPDSIPFSYPSLQNRFNYITLSFSGKYLKNENHKLKISPIGGISVNYLVSRKIESEKIYPIYDFYPVNQYKNNWNKVNLEYLLGVSIFQLNKFSLDFGFKRSLTPLLSVETLEVKDWIWTVNLNISLKNFI